MVPSRTSKPYGWSFEYKMMSYEWKFDYKDKMVFVIWVPMHDR